MEGSVKVDLGFMQRSEGKEEKRCERWQYNRKDYGTAGERRMKI
jgi:hypothetical protein